MEMTIHFVIFHCISSAPPSAPTNLTTDALNATFVWKPPSDDQSPSLSYNVLVKNGSGILVYNETVREPRWIIPTPDPCDHYEATVTAVYMYFFPNLTCAGNSTMKILGGE